MFVYLVLLFTVLPALELAVLIKVGNIIGVSNTILVIILTGVVGAYLARLQGFLILRNIQKDLQKGAMPTEEMINGLMVLVGGIVLLTPGFITDTFGLLLLFPPTRSIIKLLLKSQFTSHISASGFHYSDSSSSSFTPKNRLPDDDDIEDADFH